MNYWLYLIKQAWTSLKQKPGFVFGVVTTMGLTVGSLLYAFTMLYLILLQPLPYPDAGNLYTVSHDRYSESNESMYGEFSYPNLIRLNNSESFEKSAMSYFGEISISSLDSQPSFVSRYITPEWFDLLGTSFLMGRGFKETEKINSFNPVAVISYATWINDFDGDPDVLSTKIRVNGVTFSIVGVTAASFIDPQIKFFGWPAQIYLPWDYNKVKHLEHEPAIFDSDLEFYGRLSKSTSLPLIEDRITSSINSQWQDDIVGTPFNGQRIQLRLVSFRQATQGDIAKTLWLLLFGTVSLVFISVCNVTNLFVAYTAENQQKMAVQAAVGAKKIDLFKSFLVESSLLMIFSLIVALLVASFCFYVSKITLVYYVPRVVELSLSLVPIVFALMSVFAIALIFATISTRVIDYHKLINILNSSGKGTGIQISKKLRSTLIASQVYIALVLVFVCIGLTINSIGIITTPTGYNSESLSYVTFQEISESTEPLSEDESRSIMSEVKTKLEQIPNVEAVSQSVFLLSMHYGVQLQVFGTEENMSSQLLPIDHKYFPMIQQTFITGNNFVESDIKDSASLIVINDVLASKLDENGDAMGKKVTFNGKDIYQVIGIVKGVQVPGSNKVPPRLYVPYKMQGTEFILKMKQGQLFIRDDLAKVIRSITNKYRVYGFEEELSSVSNTYLFKQNFSAIMAIAIGSLTILLSALGLFGVLNYSIRMRRLEIGIRMTVGAKKSQLIYLIFIDNLMPFTVGVALFIITLLSVYLGQFDISSTYLNFELVAAAFASLLIVTLTLFLAGYIPLKKYINMCPIKNLRLNEN